MRKLILNIVLSALLCNNCNSLIQSQEPTGRKQMTSIEHLPFSHDQVIKVIYDGSNDKKKDNADWNWWLSQNKNGEWMLFDVDGPGCLNNFVAHHDEGKSDLVFRFYFDGTNIPAFKIRHSKFGMKYPFIEPLAAKCVRSSKGRHRLFAIVRSFCPVPFRNHIKVTSSIQLNGNSISIGGGGWGHIIYHVYSSDNMVKTITGKENYQPLLDSWNKVGEDPKNPEGNLLNNGIIYINAGGSETIYKKSDSGYLASIKLNIPEEPMKGLTDLWIRIKWEGESTHAIDCPIGAFFGNELGLNDIRTILHMA